MNSNTEIVHVYSIGTIVDQFMIVTDPSSNFWPEIIIESTNHPFSVLKPILNCTKQEIIAHLLNIHIQMEISKIKNLVLRQQLEILKPAGVVQCEVLKVELIPDLIVEFDLLNEYKPKPDPKGRFIGLKHQIHDWDLLEYKQSILDQLVPKSTQPNLLLPEEIHNSDSDTKLRTEFIKELIKKPFLLEYGPDFVSFMIVIKVNLDQQESEEIIGACVLNIHLKQYPNTEPTVMMASPLYFDSKTSNCPACRPLKFAFKRDPKSLVSSIFSNLSDQIVNFHSFLVQNGSRKHENP